MSAAADALVVLRQARALIEKPEHWTQGAFARDALRRQVRSFDAMAVCWCAVGAVGRVHPTDDSTHSEALAALLRAVPGCSVAGFNDAPVRTHAEVLALYDRAIACLTGEAS